MTYDELLDQVMEVTGLAMRPAARVANELHDEARVSYGPGDIQMVACKLGLVADIGEEPPARTLEQRLADALTKINCEADPAAVMAHVYRECPRMLVKQDGHLGVYPPRIGKAPQSSVFYEGDENAWLREIVEDLPEHIRLLIGEIDVYHGSLTITMYDEANDVDRFVGPIDLTGFESGTAIHDAIGELLKRLPRVIASDWN